MFDLILFDCYLIKAILEAYAAEKICIAFFAVKIRAEASASEAPLRYSLSLAAAVIALEIHCLFVYFRTVYVTYNVWLKC